MSEITFWRDHAMQSAKEFGLENDVAESYDKLIEYYYPEEAAFHACYEWDIILQEVKMEKILKHDDHNLPQEVIDWGFEQLQNFLETTGLTFCAHTFTMPDNLPDVENALYGPISGDAPVTDSEVTLAKRGDRPWTDRMIAKPPRPSRQLTIIGGIIEGTLTAFTMHGGPLADRNPADPTNPNPKQSEIFWSQHALAGV